jgi:RHS repeat-associated protein
LTYDDWSLLEERDSTGTLTDKYIHGATIDELIVRYNGSPVWYHHDGLGSTIAVTDNTGALTESYTYDVYGAVSVFDGSGVSQPSTLISNRFAFTGREFLAELRLYDYRNRVYSQGLGRFLQTDPIRLWGNDVNLYRYVRNKSVNQIDPEGLRIWRCITGTIGDLFTHAYLYCDTCQRPRCERQRPSIGGGDPVRKGAPPPDWEHEHCDEIFVDQKTADDIMECCWTTAHTKPWVPFLTDCHNIVNDCLRLHEVNIRDFRRIGGRGLGPNESDKCTGPPSCNFVPARPAP